MAAKPTNTVIAPAPVANLKAVTATSITADVLKVTDIEAREIVTGDLTAVTAEFGALVIEGQNVASRIQALLDQINSVASGASILAGAVAGSHIQSNSIHSDHLTGGLELSSSLGANLVPDSEFKAPSIYWNVEDGAFLGVHNVNGPGGNVYSLTNPSGTTQRLALLNALAGIGTANGSIAFVAGTTATTTSTPLSMTVPASTLAGHLLIAIVVAAYGSTITPPAGWVAVPGTSSISDGAQEQIAACYRIATGTDAGTVYSWSLTGTSLAAGAMLVYSGVNSTTPLTAASAATALDATPITPSGTAFSPSSWVVSAYGTNGTFTAPSSPAPTVRESVSYSSGVTYGLWTGDTPAGAIGPTTPYTGSSSGSDWTALTIPIVNGLITSNGPANATFTLKANTAYTFSAWASYDPVASIGSELAVALIVDGESEYQTLTWAPGESGRKSVTFVSVGVDVSVTLGAYIDWGISTGGSFTGAVRIAAPMVQLGTKMTAYTPNVFDVTSNLDRLPDGATFKRVVSVSGGNQITTTSIVDGAVSSTSVDVSTGSQTVTTAGVTLASVTVGVDSTNDDVLVSGTMQVTATMYGNNGSGANDTVLITAESGGGGIFWATNVGPLIKTSGGNTEVASTGPVAGVPFAFIHTGYGAGSHTINLNAVIGNESGFQSMTVTSVVLVAQVLRV